MIERFNPASLPASQTLIGNLLQLNTIIIRDCVRVIESEFFLLFREEVFFCLAIIKNFEKCLISMQYYCLPTVVMMMTASHNDTWRTTLDLTFSH